MVSTLVGRLGGVPIRGYFSDIGSVSMRKWVHFFGNDSTTTRVHSFFGNSSTRMRVHSSYTAYSFLSILFLSPYDRAQKLPNVSMVCCGYLNV